MSIISFLFSNPIKTYLGVNLNKREPFLKFKDKTHVTSCAQDALKGYSKPDEQRVILDLLIRKLERQDISDPKLTEGLDAAEVQFVRREVDHLLSCAFQAMKEKKLDAEGIRKARHQLAVELGRHVSHNFPKSVALIGDFGKNVGVRNQTVSQRESELPIPSNPHFIDALDFAWRRSKTDLEKSDAFARLTPEEKSAVLAEAQSPRFGLAREVYSTFFFIILRRQLPALGPWRPIFRGIWITLLQSSRAKCSSSP